MIEWHPIEYRCIDLQSEHNRLSVDAITVDVISVRYRQNSR